MNLEGIIKQANSIPFAAYDITFCGMDNCKRKSNCHRYIMYQIYKNDKRKNKPPHIYMYNGESETCKMYWQHEVFGL